ncbi:uncharacterized protein LOC118444673 isoform X1 [Vespa mandarinia]|uniref:uncharacterized protein LOC118444673 isoform X1 n=1 Tax=Vespa mandarinia TaxID=7446 RepID=UPI00160ED20F|nr:uncharacterized protein LOC118444673 isoform X1 [Vespa mandarinia]
MEKKHQSVSGTPDENVYRKRRNSYSEAMTEENTIEDHDLQHVERRYSRGSLETGSTILRRSTKSRENSSIESVTWSSTSFDSKRDLNRTTSANSSSKSWSEAEIHEVLRSYPDILSRLTRCKCYVDINNKCQCRCRYQCSCNQCCNRQRRRISAISRRDSFGSFKRKDSSYSVSTCQSFLPPTSGRNSAVSLYRIGNYNGQDSDQNETIVKKDSIQRRHSDQTHFVRGCQIEYADRRRYSEQTPRDTICECTARCNNHLRSRLSSRFLAKAGQKRSWLSFQRASTDDVAVKEADETDNEKDGNDSGISSVPENRRKSNATEVNPKMYKRRFSEQLILEAGLSSFPDFETLVTERDDNAEDEEESFTGINARKRLTLKKHYYPEGGWGRTIILVAVLVQLLSHGLQLAAGVILTPTINHFQHDVRDAGIDVTRSMEKHPTDSNLPRIATSLADCVRSVENNFQYRC